MNFTDRAFLPFIVVVFVLWLFCRRNYWATLRLLIGASLFFYAYKHWWLLGLLLGYCLVDWLCGLWIARSRRPRLPLTIGVAFNLSVLVYWKYVPLLVRSLLECLNWFDLSLSIEPPRDAWLPWGISFYSFTGIAYLVDVYRGQTPAEASFVRFSLYKAFFPQLVAGPILRPHEFLVQLQPDSLPDRSEAPLEATCLIARGLFKKMVLADRIGLAIDPFFAHVADGGTEGVWSLPYVYLYALQIYFDFSGYTDIARGLGLFFGFRWPENFRTPYLAANVSEFWKRWHITLSRFLRDYLYIPLGGNRRGPWRTCVNLMLTMLLGGLWHGGTWSFLVWGGLHGLFLIVHRFWCATAAGVRLAALQGRARLIYRALMIVLTFHAVCLSWCFFRLTVFAESLVCVRKCLFFDPDKLLVGGAADPSLWLPILAYGVGASLFLFGPCVLRRRVWADENAGPLRQGFAWGVCVALLLVAIGLAPGGARPAFLYFQF